MNVKLFRVIFFTLVVPLCLLFCLHSHAQTNSPYWQHKYDSTLGMNRPLFIGFSYMRIGYKTNGHPFFLTDSLQACTLSYNKTIYRNLPVQLDIHQPALVTNDGSNNLISLITEQVDSLEIAGRYFFPVIQVVDGRAVNELMELVERGPITLYKRHRKVLQKPSGPDANLLPAFKDRPEWLVKSATGWSWIETEKQLLLLVPAKAEEIKSLIKKNRWSFRKDPDQLIRSVVHFINSTL